MFDFENPDKEGKDPNCEQLRKMLTTKSEEKKGSAYYSDWIAKLRENSDLDDETYCIIFMLQAFSFSWLRGRIDNLRGVSWVFSRSILLISGRIWHGVIFRGFSYTWHQKV